MGAAGALIPLSMILVVAVSVAASACGRTESAESQALKPTETIVGRAAWNGRTAVLTDAPALIVIEPRTRTLSRRALSIAPGTSPNLWGLGEDDGSLFTVSAFADLVRIEGDGRATAVARVERPLANLFDLDDGMGGQYASGDGGLSLAVRVRADGSLVPLHGPHRETFGLSPVEEGILNLFSCSSAPLVVCWRPGRGILFEFTASTLLPSADLERLPEMPPALVVAGNARAIDDVIASADGGFLVLHSTLGNPGRQQITTFHRSGTQVGSMALEIPLRLLLSRERRSVVALARTGEIVSLDLR